jgi:hypothetical protein
MDFAILFLTFYEISGLDPGLLDVPGDFLRYGRNYCVRCRGRHTSFLLITIAIRWFENTIKKARAAFKPP